MPVRVVLLAGGKGERFWPRSTPEMPKQFLRIAGTKSLLRATFDRVVRLVPPSSVYVVTGAAYEELTRRELPELPGENVILEPEARDTAPALGLAALWLQQDDPDCTMIVLPADHHIVGERKFSATLEAAVEAASRGGLVTLGVHPTRQETGYGYIQVGDAIAEYRGLPLHRVLRFVEKPDAPTAEFYLASGEYLWNSGMFVWRVDCLRAEIEKHLPSLHAVLEELAATGGRHGIRAALPNVFHRAPKISIDYGVLEKSDRVQVVPAYFGWDDVGSWSAVERLRARDEHGNCLTGEIVTYDSHNLVIEGHRRLIATVGVSDLIVVDSENALLISHRSRAQDVKKVVALAAPFTRVNRDAAVSPEGRAIEHSWGREIVWATTDQFVCRYLEVKAGEVVRLQFSQTASLLVHSGRGHVFLGETWHDVEPGNVKSVPSRCELAASADLAVTVVSSGESRASE